MVSPAAIKDPHALLLTEISRCTLRKRFTLLLLLVMVLMQVVLVPATKQTLQRLLLLMLLPLLLPWRRRGQCPEWAIIAPEARGRTTGSPTPVLAAAPCHGCCCCCCTNRTRCQAGIRPGMCTPSSSSRRRRRQCGCLCGLSPSLGSLQCPVTDASAVAQDWEPLPTVRPSASPSPPPPTTDHPCALGSSSRCNTGCCRDLIEIFPPVVRWACQLGPTRGGGWGPGSIAAAGGAARRDPCCLLAGESAEGMNGRKGSRDV